MENNKENTKEEAQETKPKRRRRHRENTIRVTAYLTQKQYQQLDIMAEEEGLSLTQVLSQALDERWVRRYKNKPEIAWKDEDGIF